MLKGSIYSALPLSDAERRELEKHFGQLLNDTVELTVIRDESLIGGVQVRIGDFVYDGSLSQQLKMVRSLVRGGLIAERGAVLPEDWTDTGNAQTVLNRQAVARQARQRTMVDPDQPDLSIGEQLKSQLDRYAPMPDVRISGRVLSTGDGAARVEGLEECKVGELLHFGDDGFAIAMNLERNTVGAVLLCGEGLQSGHEIVSTGQVISVPVGDALLGRVVNPLGQPLDDRGPIESDTHRPIESPAPAIFDRQSVYRPMMTGILAIDATVPIGKGQRELIIGDRKTGKTTIAVDAILNQKGKGVYCVYVAIGQKASTTAALYKSLQDRGAMEYTTLVVSTASDNAPMQYIAPYAGCAMAEEWMDAGKDVLIVYDDLSKHAVAYRAMSLLLRRPPGREAYPGDVFYLHSRLLERAAQLNQEKGGGSMTALPIVETLAGDISAYIPTNVISITDGQIFLESELFSAGNRPALNVGLSVSRVGGAAQAPALRKASGPLRLTLAQYRELKVFAQFGSDLDEETHQQLLQGERLTELIKQPAHAPLSMAEQTMLLTALRHPLMQGEVSQVVDMKKSFLSYLRDSQQELLTRLDREGTIDDSMQAMMEEAIQQYARLRGGNAGQET